MNKTLEEEQKFQDLKVTDNIRKEYSVFYEDNVEISNYLEKVLTNCIGRILIYGCGDVDITSFVQKGFSEVIGIDISPKSIEKINVIIHEKKLENTVKTFVMDAQAMTFEDGSFDVIFGTGILHHLDVEKSMKEIDRVLKPEGKIIFMEPLGINPIINLYRSRTQEARTEYEHPFRLKDIKIIKNYFRVRSKGFYLFTILSFGFKTIIKSNFLYKISRLVLSGLDMLLLSLLPLDYLCWIIVIEGKKRNSTV